MRQVAKGLLQTLQRFEPIVLSSRLMYDLPNVIRWNLPGAGMKIQLKQIIRSNLMLVAVMLAVSLPARGQGLPEGEGLSVVIVSCTQCHGLDRLTKIELTAAEWENALYDMMARGAVVEKKDLANIREYLVKNFATDRN
jgi:hypothetical protein